MVTYENQRLAVGVAWKTKHFNGKWKQLGWRDCVEKGTRGAVALEYLLQIAKSDLKNKVHPF